MLPMTWWILVLFSCIKGIFYKHHHHSLFLLSIFYVFYLFHYPALSQKGFTMASLTKRFLSYTISFVNLATFSKFLISNLIHPYSPLLSRNQRSSRGWLLDEEEAGGKWAGATGCGSLDAQSLNCPFLLLLISNQRPWLNSIDHHSLQGQKARSVDVLISFEALTQTFNPEAVSGVPGWVIREPLVHTPFDVD